MKGIVLSGGTGSRLWPMTRSVSKQLLPVYDKPLIYYPLATLMQFGIREILVITTPHEQGLFKNLLGDGSQWGIKLTFAIQEKPNGLADAFIIGEKFIDNHPVMLILGDNIFHSEQLNAESLHFREGATIFTFRVSNPSAYGVLELNETFDPISIEEKPLNPKSDLAVTGLYYFGSDVSFRSKKLKPSERGEIEITSLIETYLIEGQLDVVALERGSAWLDSGTPQSLNDASNYIRILEERTGQKVACLEEIAISKNWIEQNQIEDVVRLYRGNDYARYLASIGSSRKDK